MAYRFEENQKGIKELVIDGWENGIADSPYEGIASLKNLNIKYYPKVTYVNYKQKAITLPTTDSIAFDNSALIGSTSTTNSVLARDNQETFGGTTGNFTCSGINRLLVISLETYNGTSAVSATYNGVSMTAAYLNQTANSGSSVLISMFYLLNPASGSNAISITLGGSFGNSLFNAVSYTGVSASAGLVTKNTATNTGATSLSVALTCTGNNWGIGTWYHSVGGESSTNASCFSPQADGDSIWDTNGVQTGNFSMTVTPTNTSGSPANGAFVLVFASAASTTISLSGSYTCSSTASRVLFVQTNLTPLLSAMTVTYNSVSLTKLRDITDSNGIGQSIWYLIAPASGSNTVAVSATAGTGTIELIVNAISYTGVSQGSTFATSTVNTTIPASSQSLSVTSLTNNCWTFMAVSCFPNTTATAGASTTIRQNNQAASSEIILCDSNASISTPSASSLIVNFSGSVTDTTAIIISIPPTVSIGQFMNWTSSPAGIIYLIDSGGNVFKQSAVGSSTFNSLTGNSLTNAAGQGIAFWNNYLIVFRATQIDYCGDGTGDAGVTSSNWNTATGWPIATQSTVSLTGTPASGSTSATLSSAWGFPTGTYKATIALSGTPSSQVVSASLTKASTAITWTPALVGIAAGASIASISILTSGSHISFISSNDSNLYVQNGNNVFALAVPSGQTFNPAVYGSYTVNYKALGLPDYEQVSYISELRTNLLVGGIRKVYPWDRVSTSWQTPIPVTEPINKIINIMNNIYILAGDKGNLYFSNGYTVAPLKKIPDAFFSAYDPEITWGGIMAHRLKLWFQVYAIDSISGSALGSGIFSYDITTQALNFENQNSPGFVPAGTSGVGNVLVDISDTSSAAYDSYISSWYNNGVGGLDFNDTTLYSNNEPQIESDLIPVGTAIQPMTFSQIEFKLDKPMVTGDSISVYARQSLSDTYHLLGTTTTSVLSDNYNQWPIQSLQWLQIKATMSCASSGSSRLPLREIRIR